MFTVLEDTVKNHWGNMGGRCTSRLGELSGHDNPAHYAAEPQGPTA